jgi:hypothetical protein
MRVTRNPLSVWGTITHLLSPWSQSRPSGLVRSARFGQMERVEQTRQKRIRPGHCKRRRRERLHGNQRAQPWTPPNEIGFPEGWERHWADVYRGAQGGVKRKRSPILDRAVPPPRIRRHDGPLRPATPEDLKSVSREIKQLASERCPVPLGELHRMRPLRSFALYPS